MAAVFVQLWLCRWSRYSCRLLLSHSPVNVNWVVYLGQYWGQSIGWSAEYSVGQSADWGKWILNDVGVSLFNFPTFRANNHIISSTFLICYPRIKTPATPVPFGDSLPLIMHSLYGVIGMPVLFQKQCSHCEACSFSMVACYSSCLLLFSPTNIFLAFPSGSVNQPGKYFCIIMQIL